MGGPEFFEYEGGGPIFFSNFFVPFAQFFHKAKGADQNLFTYAKGGPESFMYAKGGPEKKLATGRHKQTAPPSP